MSRRRGDRSWLALLVCAVGVIAPSDAAASGADRLALQTADVIGLERAPADRAGARRELARLLPGRARERARAEARSFRAGRFRLDVQAFALRGAAPARAALAGWGRAQRRARRRPANARLGVPGLVATTRKGGVSDSRVALRAGAGFAILRLRAPWTARAARAAALRYAGLEADRLRRALDRTIWERIHDGVRSDGTIPPRTLLRMAAALYGPIDGVRLPAGRRRWPAMSGTHVLDELRRAALSPEQRAALESTLGRAGGRRDRGAPRARSALGSCRDALTSDGVTLALDAAERDIALALRAEIAARMGFGTPAWDVCVYPRPAGAGAHVVLDAWSWWRESSEAPSNEALEENSAEHGTPNICVVHVYPGAPADRRRFDLAHEMYHCLHKERTNGDSVSAAWIKEGLANWSAQQVAPLPAAEGVRPGSAYRHYYENWADVLFSRTYDGFGFWSLVEQAGSADAIWGRVPALWDARDNNPVAFAAATGGEADAVMDAWAPALFREPSHPAGWMQVLPWAVPDSVVPVRATPSVELAATPSVQVDAAPYSTALAVVRGSATAPLVQVRGAGNARITDGTSNWGSSAAFGGELASKWFCFDDCGCPAGLSPRPGLTIPEHTVVGGELDVALAGGAGTSRLQFEAHELTEFCAEAEDPDPPAGAVCGRVTGAAGLGGEFPLERAVELPQTARDTAQCQLYYGASTAVPSSSHFNGGRPAQVFFYRQSRRPGECEEGTVVTAPRPSSPAILDGAFFQQGGRCASVLVGFGCIRFHPLPPQSPFRECNLEAHNAAVLNMVTSGIAY